MAGGSNKVRVAICGSEYTVRGHAPEEHLQLVAKQVDDMMQKVAAANPNLDTRRIAVLTALNIADQLYELRTKYEELLNLLDENTRASSKR
jgi:cell division protein ZapA